MYEKLKSFVQSSASLDKASSGFPIHRENKYYISRKESEMYIHSQNWSKQTFLFSSLVAVLPFHSGGQVQLKPSLPLAQVPPLAHGLLAQ